LKSAAYHSGQQEIRQHLEDCVTEAATGIGSEMEYTQLKTINELTPASL